MILPYTIPHYMTHGVNVLMILTNNDWLFLPCIFTSRLRYSGRERTSFEMTIPIASDCIVVIFGSFCVPLQWLDIRCAAVTD